MNTCLNHFWQRDAFVVFLGCVTLSEIRWNIRLKWRHPTTIGGSCWLPGGEPQLSRLQFWCFFCRRWTPGGQMSPVDGLWLFHLLEDDVVWWLQHLVVFRNRFASSVRWVGFCSVVVVLGSFGLLFVPLLADSRVYNERLQCCLFKWVVRLDNKTSACTWHARWNGSLQFRLYRFWTPTWSGMTNSWVSPTSWKLRPFFTFLTFPCTGFDHPFLSSRSTKLCKLHPITAVSTPDLEAGRNERIQCIPNAHFENNWYLQRSVLGWYYNDPRVVGVICIIQLIYFSKIGVKTIETAWDSLR